jgi:hypothetical protein
MNLIPIHPAADHPEIYAKSRAAAEAQLKPPLPDTTPQFHPTEAPHGKHDREEVSQPEETKVPKGIIPLPQGGISYTESGRIMFDLIGKHHRLFKRGGCLVEVTGGEITTVTPERFCSLIETYGSRVARREIHDGKPVYRTAVLPKNHASILMASPELSRVLPLRQISNCAIITKDCRVLAAGYHDHEGGSFVSPCQPPSEMTLEAAKVALMTLLNDFLFPTPSDLSRAVASLLSPALKKGGWLAVNETFPNDVSEAEVSQSGKTLRLKVVCALYGEKFIGITPPNGGVGSLDESIGTALLSGRTFISIDNVRGKIVSGIMESAMTGDQTQARGFGKTGIVKSGAFLWQISTNGAEFTTDLANRSIITRIRKRPEGFPFHQFNEGGIIAHLMANGPFYLGAVFTILKEWAKHGCPKTGESRHDFREWCRSLDWIIQNIFEMAPLLDGHKDEQLRTANPSLTWLRDVSMAVRSRGQLGQALTTGDLVGIAEDADIDFPGNRASRDEPPQRAGKMLGPLFRQAGGDRLIVDGMLITREERLQYVEGKGNIPTKFYTISEA